MKLAHQKFLTSDWIQIPAVQDQNGKKGNHRSFNPEKTRHYQFSDKEKYIFTVG